MNHRDKNLQGTDPKPKPWKPSATRQTAWLVGCFAVCFAAAGIGGYATSTSVGDWFQTLAKPDWRPPNWLFGPVWTTLYAMMAIAAWLVWRKDGWKQSRIALTWFAIQLALNVVWSVIFFGLRMPGLAFAEITILWMAIVATTIAFRKISGLAALFMTPYLAWTSFAAILNLAIWRMNS